MEKEPLSKSSFKKMMAVDPSIFEDAETDELSLGDGSSPSDSKTSNSNTFTKASTATAASIGYLWGLPSDPIYEANSRVPNSRSDTLAVQQSSNTRKPDETPPFEFLSCRSSPSRNESRLSFGGVSELERDIQKLATGPGPVFRRSIENTRTRGTRLQSICIHSPKSALHTLYGQKPRNFRTEKSDFFSWMEGPPHNMLFSSVFVCPLTGEAFPSGRYGDPADYMTKSDPKTGLSIVYYKRKINAEHGAAARAHDCLIHRDNSGDDTLCDYIGIEDPSYTPGALPLPSVIPSTLLKMIEESMLHGRSGLVESDDKGEESTESTCNDSDFAWRPYEVDTTKHLFD